MRFATARATPQVDDFRGRRAGSRIQQGFQGFTIAAWNKIIQRWRGQGNEIENELLHADDYTFAH